jgi:metaxin
MSEVAGTGQVHCQRSRLTLRKAYLRFCGIRFRTVAANNHASPTGALPFLNPASSASTTSSHPIPSYQMLRWVTSHASTMETSEGMRYEAYTSLVEHRIRNAWLFTLYLDERNSEAVAKKLYIHPASSNSLVQVTLQRQLRQAARDELLKTRSYIREDELYMEAENAFMALSTLLGDDAFFFGNEKPTLFDASLFAYTHLLLNESFSWQNTRLADSLRKMKNLAQHRERLLDRYFDGQNNMR